MRCKKARQKISPYIDGELKEEERALLEAHLSSCHTCHQALEEEVELWEELRFVELKEPSTLGLWSRIESNLEHEQKFSTKLSFLRLLTKGNMAMILSLCIGLFVGLALSIMLNSNNVITRQNHNYKITLAQEAFEGDSPLLDVALSMSYTPEQSTK